MKRLDRNCAGCGELFLVTDLTNSRCTSCRRESNRDYYLSADRGRLLCYWSKQRAKKKSIPFDLDPADIVNRIRNGVCELSGLRFSVDAGLNFYSPSLDQIEPGGGYTKENVRVILYGWNVALGTWGESTLREAIIAWGIAR